MLVLIVRTSHTSTGFILCRMNKFTADVLGMQEEIKIPKMDVRGYAKCVLKNGTVEAKRDLLSCLDSKLLLLNNKLSIA